MSANAIDASAANGRLEWSAAELLSEHGYEEPLWAGAVRCHGGFIGGRYVSPRTALREPAIAAWQARLRAEGLPLVGIADAWVPPHYPSCAQAVLLLQEGIAAPI